MGIFFSKHKLKSEDKLKSNLSKVTEHDKTVLLLKQQRDKLKQYHKRINNQIEKEREIARKLVKNGQKQRALLLLRKKKFMESLLDKSEAELNNVEQMTHNIEFAVIETNVLDSLKTGNEALKVLHSILDIDKIEEILDETKEGIEKQKEIDQLIQRNNVISENDEDLLAELEQYLPVEELPDVPKQELPKIEDIEKKENEITEKVQKQLVEAS